MKKVLLQFFFIFLSCNFCFAVDVLNYDELNSALQNSETDINLKNNIFFDAKYLVRVNNNTTIDANNYAFEGGGDL
ncbi:hypothetical protein IJ425_08140 [bacterium]|nr:hypothetical protein [bacterium]